MNVSINVNDDSLLKAYSQERYGFNPDLLSTQEIKAIKQLAKEKRIDFGLSPIGEHIFKYLFEKEGNIFFEGEKFNNPDLDAILYMPDVTTDNVFIILNTNQPLLNQIFATAHEYYHYLNDVDFLRKNPHVCSLTSMDTKNEQKASRFAAEFLLPDEALRKSVNYWLDFINKKEFSDADLIEAAYLCYGIAIEYALPLKAVLYRLYEEKYIHNIDQYITNYEFIKKSFRSAIRRYSKQASELLNAENPYIIEYMYDYAINAFRNGFVTLEKLEHELEILNLNKEIVLDDLDIDLEEDTEEIPDDLKASLYRDITGKG